MAYVFSFAASPGHSLADQQLSSCIKMNVIKYCMCSTDTYLCICTLLYSGINYGTELQNNLELKAIYFFILPAQVFIVLNMPVFA
jgi:hypothetical protein